MYQITVIAPPELGGLLDDKLFHVEHDYGPVLEWVASWDSGVTEQHIAPLRVHGQPYLAIIRYDFPIKLGGAEGGRIEVRVGDRVWEINSLDSDGHFAVKYSSEGPDEESLMEWTLLNGLLMLLARRWGMRFERLQQIVLD